MGSTLFLSFVSQVDITQILHLLDNKITFPWVENAEFRNFSDSLNCVDVIKGMVKPSEDDSEFKRVTFETIRALLLVQLKTKTSVIWVPRDDNQRADWIAFWTRCSGSGSGHWVDWEVLLDDMIT